MIYVIGSGPAGVSVAMALTGRGLDVTMLDAGYELEPKKKAIVARLQQQKKSDWSKEGLKALRTNMRAHMGGLETKAIYGSDYPYRGMNSIQPLRLEGAKMVRSLARGGLSTVWGASILPFRQPDIEDWPITIEDLAPHYRAVLHFMAHAGDNGQMGDILPCHSDKFQNFQCSAQAGALLADLHKERNTLHAQGIFYGKSRLAVDFNPKTGESCAYCGLCLYGCPYGNIYSSASTLDALLLRKNFHYIGGVVVEKIHEKGSELRIHGRTLIDMQEKRFHGNQAFLAAGLLSSTRIVLNSMEAYNQFLETHHSDQFQAPLIRMKVAGSPALEELHTLAQLNMEIINKAVSRYTVHLQMYTYNDLYEKVFEGLIGRLGVKILHWPISQFISRLLIIKGYLHSHLSSKLHIGLESENGALVVRGQPNPKARQEIQRIVGQLHKNKKALGATLLPWFIKLGQPGSGNHSGGSLPMHRSPGPFQTDTLGRPQGFSRLHVVDSSTLPTVPATTITLSVMANAHRIGTLCKC